MSGESDGSAQPSPRAEDLNDLEQVYRDFHQHPELSMQEHRTSGIVGKRIKELGYEVTAGVGGTGVVGVLGHPTLEIGIEAMVTGALRGLAGDVGTTVVEDERRISG